MMMAEQSRRFVAALCAGVALCGVNAAAAADPYAFEIDFRLVDFSVESRTTSPPREGLGAAVRVDVVSGFTDPASPLNFVELRSPSGAIEGGLGPLDPNTTNGYESVADVAAEVNSGLWRLFVSDGATGESRFFDLGFSLAPDIDERLFRRITPTNYFVDQPFDRANPFMWDVEPSFGPEADFDRGRGIVANFADPIDPAATTWAPSQTLPITPPGGFVMVQLEFVNTDAIDPSQFELTSFNISDGGPLASASIAERSVSSYSFVGSVPVVPAPGAAGLLVLAGGFGVRRRRR